MLQWNLSIVVTFASVNSPHVLTVEPLYSYHLETWLLYIKHLITFLAPVKMDTVDTVQLLQNLCNGDHYKSILCIKSCEVFGVIFEQVCKQFAT